MKTILIALLFIVPLLGRAQFSFEPNSDTTIFDTPQDTSAIFQYKFIVASAWHFSSYLELTYNQDSTWSYSRTVISNIDSKRIELPPIDPPVNVDKLWKELINVEFLNLKTEDEITYIVTKDGKYVELPFEKYQMMGATDMSNYVSEFYSKLGIRTIMHYAPIEMMSKLHQSDQTWYVPELYKATFCYTLIQNKFHFTDYRNAFAEYFKSINEDKSKRKKRR
ncbi:hypothetical protein JKA74_09380 [Marivirga sp. S37H4]|uniref:Uncharacterized protein n=1 Tax=Marivirga aurantiaca TaxID=2802615 RepID=A0A934WYR1_9BACT|nr:hypothetical protein [Marivirga aurantiaca]MBK6265250.1 hypothetical protein [Marivirga aurantiaca]